MKPIHGTKVCLNADKKKLRARQLTKKEKSHIIYQTKYPTEMWEKSRVHSPRKCNDRLILTVCRFYFSMGLTEKKQHLTGLLMLGAVAILWGAGFVLNAQLVGTTFAETPSLLNAVRFGVSVPLLLAVFNKRIRIGGKTLLYGAVGGALLFVGFLVQVVGMKYTTPSHSGFFTAFYVVPVPFAAWLVYRRRPHWAVFAGTAVAIGGLVLLNFTHEESGATAKGDLLTFAGAIAFALQIVWADYVLKKKKTDYVQLTFWQVTFAAILFAAYSLIFESKHYAAMEFDVGYGLWRLAIVTLGGTAFAYYAQTYAQTRLSPTETSLLLACESPIGAILSVAVGMESFVWQTAVGGVLVVAAVLLVELVPSLAAKRKAARNANDSAPIEAGAERFADGGENCAPKKDDEPKSG